MKQWFLCTLLLCLSLAAEAQYIRRSGSDLIQNGEKLSPQQKHDLLSDIDGKNYNLSWNSANALRKTGIGLTVGGGVVTATGLTVGIAGALTSMVGVVAGGTTGAIVGGNSGAQEGASVGAKAGTPLMTVGLITSGVGIAALVIGIPLITSNVRKMNRIVGRYNELHTPETSSPAIIVMGPTTSGYGLVLQF